MEDFSPNWRGTTTKVIDPGVSRFKYQARNLSLWKIILCSILPSWQEIVFWSLLGLYAVLYQAIMHSQNLTNHMTPTTVLAIEPAVVPACRCPPCSSVVLLPHSEYPNFWKAWNPWVWSPNFLETIGSYSLRNSPHYPRQSGVWVLTNLPLSSFGDIFPLKH